MKTKDFRTKTEIIPRKNKKKDGAWVIGLDIGYSSVKTFSPNIVASFPAYARRVDDDFKFIGENPESSIIYKDLKTGDMWLVGEIAQNTMITGDTSDSENTLYGRDHYSSLMFDVIAKVGLGLGMLNNEFGSVNDDEIIVQTGLPEKYLDDADEITEVLAGDYNFSLKIANNDEIKFSFTLPKENIFVMSQPKGTLLSACVNKDGQFRSDAETYLKSSVLVFDPGFGTLDLFAIVAGTVGKGETFADLGMKRVLQDTCRMIKSSYGVTVSVPEMQKYLENGYVKYFNKKTFESKEKPFGALLEEANKKVCEEAISRMMQSFNLMDFSYLIMTGGTGAAWLDIIRDKFKKLDTLQIINGNQNDNLPFIYNNVRGYYFYRVMKG